MKEGRYAVCLYTFLKLFLTPVYRYGSIIISINQLQYNPEANSNLVEEDHMCHMMMGEWGRINNKK